MAIISNTKEGRRPIMMDELRQQLLPVQDDRQQRPALLPPVKAYDAPWVRQLDAAETGRYTLFAMNCDGDVVGGHGVRVGRDGLADLINELLASGDNEEDDPKIVTHVQVHDGSCSIYVNDDDEITE